MRRWARREFLRTIGESGAVIAATTAAAHLIPATVMANRSETEPTPDQFAAFTESFQDWPIAKVCERFRDIGLDGLDLTLRPGGHIEPRNVAMELPAAVQAAKDHGVRISMLSTAITDADASAEEIFSIAGAHGISRVKLGYQHYTQFGKLLSEMDQARQRTERVAKLAAKYQVLPCVHIHSGAIIPSGGTLAYLLLRDFAPTEVGAYVDPMHMTIEGGIDGWRQGLDLLRPWIAISSLKNCFWKPTGRDERGQQRWKPAKCPLADGIAPIPDYLKCLRESNYHGLFTLHSEYTDQNSWRLLTTEECLDQTRRDLEYVRPFLAGN